MNITQKEFKSKKEFLEVFESHVNGLRDTHPLRGHRLKSVAYLIVRLINDCNRLPVCFKTQRLLGEQARSGMARETVNKIVSTLIKDGIINVIYRGDKKSLAYDLNYLLLRCNARIVDDVFILRSDISWNDMEDMLTKVFIHSLSSDKRSSSKSTRINLFKHTQLDDSVSFVTHISYYTSSEILSRGLAMLLVGGRDSKQSKSEYRKLKNCSNSYMFQMQNYLFNESSPETLFNHNNNFNLDLHKSSLLTLQTCPIVLSKGFCDCLPF